MVAGYHTMLRTGLSSLRTRDVAAEAGITVATLHYYFPTKDDLVRAVLEHAIRERIVLPLDLDGRDLDGPDRLRAMLLALARHAETDPGHFRLLHEMTWASHTDPELRTLMATWHGDWHAVIVGWLRAGQRDGRVRTDIDTDTVAEMVIYLVFGVVLRPPMPAGDHVRLTDELDRLLASIAPPPDG